MSKKIKERVVLADICEVCESIVGVETVVEMTPSEIENEKKGNELNFFAKIDSFKKATYRQIFMVPSCGRC